MKRLLSIFIALVVSAMSLTVDAQQLKFNENGEFKILQLTDIHYIYGDERALPSLECIERTISTEMPDLIVVTGDLIYGKPANESFRTVMEAINKFGIPFCFTFGNHDDENGLSRSELYDIAREYSNNVQPDRGDAVSPDYCLSILSHDGSRTASVIYLFDSNAYCKKKNIGGYDWIHRNQIEWYCERSKAFTKANGDSVVPSVAFFHIPVPEFGQAASDNNVAITGTRMESGGFPKVNSGLFTAMQEMGDIMGIFVGHDHDCDFAADYKGILLAYGCYSGGNTVYNHLPNGGRVVILKEGQRRLDTYISRKNGRCLEVTYPDSFSRK